MGYYIIGIVVALVVVVLISIALSSKSENKKDKQGDATTKKIEPKHKIKEKKFPVFYVKNCVFYSNDLSRFAYDETELLILQEKFDEAVKLNDHEQVIKICEEIIKIDSKSDRVWIDYINALFSDVIKKGVEWDDFYSRKVVTCCSGFLQTYSNVIDKSTGAKQILMPTLLKRAKEMIEYQDEYFGRVYNLELYNMLINIYYMMPYKSILDLGYSMLMDYKLAENNETTEYEKRSVKSLLGHVQMLRSRYKVPEESENNKDSQKLFIDNCVLVNDSVFVTTFIGFSIGYPKNINRAQVECRFFDSDKNEIFLMDNKERYFEIFENKNEEKRVSEYDIVILGEDCISSIELDFYRDEGLCEKKENEVSEKKNETVKMEKQKGNNKEKKNEEIDIKIKKIEETETVNDIESKDEDIGEKEEEKPEEKQKVMLFFPDIYSVREIAMSETHFLALKNDGTVEILGNDEHMKSVREWKDIEKIYTSNFISYGIKKDGTIVVCGREEYDNWEYQYTWENIKKIVPSYAHLLALKEDGTAVAIGDNKFGQCDVDNWYDVVDISCNFHSVALTTEGKVLAIGENKFGECNTGKWEDITEIATGPFYTVGLKSDGTVLATGLNSCGQCNVTEWKDIKHIYARGNITVGLKYNGTAVITGNNSYRFDDIKKWHDLCDVKIVNDRIIGIDEEGKIIYKGKPYRGVFDEWSDIVDIVANSNYVVGLRRDGSIISNDLLFGVGLRSNFGGFNELKDHVISGQFAYLTSDGEVKMYCNNTYELYNYDCSRLTDIVSIDLSSNLLVGVKKDGTAVVTGKDVLLAVEVESWNNLVKLKTGDGFIVGLKIDGKVLASGNNSHGQCDVSNWTDIMDIIVLGNKTIGLKADGTVVATGDNQTGEVDFVKIFSNITGIAATNKQIMLLDSNGNVKLSFNADGVKKEKIESWKNIKKIVAGSDKFIALTFDGRLLSTDENDNHITSWTNVIDVNASGRYVWAISEQ